MPNRALCPITFEPAHNFFFFVFFFILPQLMSGPANCTLKEEIMLTGKNHRRTAATARCKLAVLVHIHFSTLLRRPGLCQRTDKSSARTPVLPRHSNISNPLALAAQRRLDETQFAGRRPITELIACQ